MLDLEEEEEKEEEEEEQQQQQRHQQQRRSAEDYKGREISNTYNGLGFNGQFL